MPTQTPTTWSADRLRAIAEADDLHVAPFRKDGEPPGTPTWVWNVAVDGNLYVRAYHGTNSRWYQAALRERTGQIRAAGETHDIAFEPTHGSINDRIDEAYRAKYAGSPSLAPMVSERARSATVNVSPRETA